MGAVAGDGGQCCRATCPVLRDASRAWPSLLCAGTHLAILRHCVTGIQPRKAVMLGTMLHGTAVLAALTGTLSACRTAS